MMSRCGLLLLMSFALCPSAFGQNVTGYDVMQDPFLFLLREPAVQKDLGLSDSQLKRLVELNESMDGLLLGSRANKTQEASNRMTSEVMEKSRAAVAELFTKKQQQRMQQIRYRLKGLSFILLQEPANELGLTQDQRETIQTTVTDASKKISKVSSNEFQGEEAQAAAQRTMVAARKEEQEAIFDAIDDSQKRKLTALVGKAFDSNSLGRVAFKAPDLIDSGEWINTNGLKLTDLRGKVVALHFFAYG